MNSVQEMIILSGPLYEELRHYVDTKGVTALAMLAKGVNGTVVTDADMPNIKNVAAALLPNKSMALLPVLDVVTPEQMDSRIDAGECSYIGAHVTMGLSADDTEVVFIDHDNPSISLWLCHTSTCSLLLVATFAQLRELVELTLTDAQQVVTAH